MSHQSPAERWEGALCTQVDPELWFPEPGQPTAPAKAICCRCPLVNECLDYAMTSEAGRAWRHGIYGGLSAFERTLLGKEAS